MRIDGPTDRPGQRYPSESVVWLANLTPNYNWPFSSLTLDPDMTDWLEGNKHINKFELIDVDDTVHTVTIESGDTVESVLTILDQQFPKGHIQPYRFSQNG